MRHIREVTYETRVTYRTLYVTYHTPNGSHSPQLWRSLATTVVDILC